MVVRQNKPGGKLVVAFINGVMLFDPQEAEQRNELSWIEQMINRNGRFRAVTRKGLFGQIFALLKLVVIVGETAASQAEAQVGVRSEQSDQTHFGVQINRRQRQAQGDIGVEKIRFVQVVISVGGHGRGSLRGLAEASLKQFSQLRIDLAQRGAGHPKNRHSEQQPAVLLHLIRLYQLPPRRKRLFLSLFQRFPRLSNDSIFPDQLSLKSKMKPKTAWHRPSACKITSRVR
jgi:hypothetical protein